MTHTFIQYAPGKIINLDQVSSSKYVKVAAQDRDFLKLPETFIDIRMTNGDQLREQDETADLLQDLLSSVSLGIYSGEPRPGQVTK